jgi:hypothetical protein
MFELPRTGASIATIVNGLSTILNATPKCLNALSDMTTKSFIIRRKVRSTSSEFAFTFRRNRRSTSVGVHNYK